MRVKLCLPRGRNSEWLTCKWTASFFYLIFNVVREIKTSRNTLALQFSWILSALSLLNPFAMYAFCRDLNFSLNSGIYTSGLKSPLSGLHPRVSFSKALSLGESISVFPSLYYHTHWILTSSYSHHWEIWYLCLSGNSIQITFLY